MRIFLRNSFVPVGWALSLCLFLHAQSALAGPNGFNLDRHAVPPEKILRGGPTRNGIPALRDPAFVTAQEAGLRPGDRVIGITAGGKAKAYPIRILNWHELVNDTVGGLPVAITYCPLCASGAAFDRRIDGRLLTFGVSGLLYNSNMLLYDRESESLWTQIGMRAITGSRTGTRLTLLPIFHGRWADWRSHHPDTRVLSFDTGHSRDYSRDPYAGYENSSRLYFPVENESALLPPKTLVFGVARAGTVRAYPLGALGERKRVIRDHFGEEVLRIRFDNASGSPRATAADETEIPGVVAYWFAWVAFYPETILWKPQD